MTDRVLPPNIESFNFWKKENGGVTLTPVDFTPFSQFSGG